jgi:hypothetical protein
MSKLAYSIILASLLFIPIFTADAAVLRTPPNNLGLVGYWSMEDGSGSTATDFSGNGNDGTLTNMDASTDWVSGKRGSALDFGGNDSQLVASSTTSIDGSEEITISAWVKADQVNTDEAIVGTKVGTSNNDDDTGFRYDSSGFSSNGSNLIKFVIRNSNGDTIAGETESGVQTTQWQHLVMTWKSGGQPRMWADGQELATLSMSSNSLSGSVDMPDFFIGTGPKRDSGHWEGKIDEVRIYNRALSASEVRDLYQSGYAKINRTAKIEEVGDPVGWWTFDGRDMDWSSDTAKDRAGSNDGTLNGGMDPANSSAPGRIGQALEFDGEDDYVEDGSSVLGNTSFTASTWFKVDKVNDQRFILDNGFDTSGGFQVFVQTDGTVRSRIDDSGANGGVFDTNSTVNDGNWHHIVTVADKSGNAKMYLDGSQDGEMLDISSYGNISGTENFRIGNQDTDAPETVNIFQGKIDDVRIYDQALSADEIQKIYDATRPSEVNASQDNELTDGLVGMWSFDGPSIDWSSNTAADVSSNSNDGTIINMSTSSAPQPGVIGQALKFDGSDDYVEVPDSNSLSQDSTISVSLWMKGKNVNSNEWNRLIEKVDSSKNEGWGLQRHQTDSYYDLRVDTSASSNQDTVVTDTVLDNQWHHLLFVLDNGEALMYQDGEKVDADSYSEGNGIANNSQLLIANSVEDRFFPGKIDQVRIYDRALSEAEIKRLYRLGR